MGIIKEEVRATVSQDRFIYRCSLSYWLGLRFRVDLVNFSWPRRVETVSEKETVVFSLVHPSWESEHYLEGFKRFSTWLWKYSWRSPIPWTLKLILLTWTLSLISLSSSFISDFLKSKFQINIRISLQCFSLKIFFPLPRNALTIQLSTSGRKRGPQGNRNLTDRRS